MSDLTKELVRETIPEKGTITENRLITNLEVRLIELGKSPYFEKSELKGYIKALYESREKGYRLDIEKHYPKNRNYSKPTNLFRRA